MVDVSTARLPRARVRVVAGGTRCIGQITQLVRTFGENKFANLITGVGDSGGDELVWRRDGVR